MSTNQWTCLGLMLILILAMSASAEFFQYVDSKGITHYTDTLSTIPPAYQSQVALHQTPSARLENNPELKKLITEQTALLEKKDALDRKFELLSAEKERVENTLKAMTDEADIALYNHQVQEINEKIQQFKKEEKRFVTEINRYNAAVKPLKAE